MQGLFVFTAGKKEARAHIYDSIAASVPVEKIREYFNDREQAILDAISRRDQGLSAWGAVPGPRNIPNWESLKSGDIVLTVYDNCYQYVSKVIWKTHNPSAAREIWGEHEGKTWEYMYFLSKPVRLDHQPSVESISDDLNSAYRGFWRFNEDKLRQLLASYGSLEEFVSKRFGVDLGNHQIPLAEIEQARTDLESGKPPVGTEDGDERNRVFREIVQRQGQPGFRRLLLAAYGGKCAITGCCVESVLEAAHIVGYNGEQSNVVTNGMLLRGDLHTLFDLGLIQVSPQYIVEVADLLSDSEYYQFNGKNIQLPEKEEDWPSISALVSKGKN